MRSRNIAGSFDRATCFRFRKRDLAECHGVDRTVAREFRGVETGPPRFIQRLPDLLEPPEAMQYLDFQKPRVRRGGRTRDTGVEIGQRCIAFAICRRRPGPDQIRPWQIAGKLNGLVGGTFCLAHEAGRQIDLCADKLCVGMVRGGAPLIERARMRQRLPPGARVRVSGNLRNRRGDLIRHAAGLEAIASSSS